MGESTENPRPQTVSRKLFEDAVDDAQYLVAYAASKCRKKIEAEKIETLLTANRLLDDDQQIDAKFEVEFWIAYQKICDLVKPVTAESIKANLPMESTFTGNLIEKTPGLSRWLGSRTTSKARRSANRYIAFPVLVLLLVLIFQIYWVIGNQLSAQLDKLLEAERNLSVQISENAQGSGVLDVQFKQDVTETQKTGLEKNLQSIESQLVQTSLIFLNWSSPWKGLITKGELEHSDTHDLLLAENDAKIADIDLQLSTDPTGINAAKSDEAGLAAQLLSVS
jgi:hypothetical protein